MTSRTTLLPSTLAGLLFLMPIASCHGASRSGNQSASRPPIAMRTEAAPIPRQPPVSDSETTTRVPMAPQALRLAVDYRCDLSPEAARYSIRETDDLLYSEVDGRRLHLDVAVPEGPGPHPMILVLHGGSWRRGHRGNARNVMRMLATHGYAAAAVTYRLARAPRTVFPTPIGDVRCAVRWLRAHARDFNLDSTRFGVIGFSAGAHLATLLGTAGDVGAMDGTCPWAKEIPANVQSVVALYGAYDLRPNQVIGQGADGVVANFLGVRAEEDPWRAALASPLAHVDPSDPPTMLIHGARDTIVNVEQSRRMSDALRASAVPQVYLEFPRAGHGFSLFPPDRHEALAGCTVLQFLSQSLRRHSS